MVELIPHLETILESRITSYKPVSGGDINEAYKLLTSSSSYFVKVNNSNRSEIMFSAEEKALVHLASTNCMRVPKVIESGKVGPQAFLLMEHIDSQRPEPSNYTIFGKQLAALHNHTQAKFGLGYDNFIGSLPQANHLHTSWSKFYVHERLRPQLQLALTKGRLQTADIPTADVLTENIQNICTDVVPALVHGDLWSGNFLIDLDGQPILIDPAIYYGDRMVDIALSKLFGGFAEEFYDAYFANSPVIENQQPKIAIYQLYYLLVHLNLFGHSYQPAVKSILKSHF